METISVQINSKALQDYIKKFSGNLDRLNTLFQRSSNIMHADIVKHFNTDKQSGDGSPWAPVRYKPKSGSILVRTSRLRNSMAQRWTNKTAEVFTNVEYGATHNFGDPKRNIPQREFMWLSKDAMDQIITIFSKEIVPS
jgi:phage gpG-like protein